VLLELNMVIKAIAEMAQAHKTAPSGETRSPKLGLRNNEADEAKTLITSRTLIGKPKPVPSLANSPKPRPKISKFERTGSRIADGTKRDKSGCIGMTGGWRLPERSCKELPTNPHKGLWGVM